MGPARSELGAWNAACDLTRALPGQPEDAPLRGIYRNPPRSGDRVCPVCTAPKDAGYSLCVPCNNHRYAGLPLADFVAPLSWAPMQTQAYEDLVSYKAEPHHTVADVATGRLRLMFRLAFTEHAQCLIPGWQDSSVAVTHVPSTSGRGGAHPLESILAMFADNVPKLQLQYVGDLTRQRDDKRSLRPDDWEVTTPGIEAYSRVLVIDDSWVTGGHAQSVASRLKLSGVPNVGIVPFGRVLRMDWPPNVQHLRDFPALTYSSAVCPVHGVTHAD